MAKDGDSEVRAALARVLGSGCPEKNVVLYPDYWNRVAGGGVEASKKLVDLFIDQLGVVIKSSLKKGGWVVLDGFGTFYVGKSNARWGTGALTGHLLRARKSVKFQRALVGWNGLGPVEEGGEGGGEGEEGGGGEGSG